MLARTLTREFTERAHAKGGRRTEPADREIPISPRGLIEFLAERVEAGKLPPDPVGGSCGSRQPKDSLLSVH